MKIKKIIIISILFLCTIINACALSPHLQHALPFPLHHLYLQSSNPYGEFETQLRQSLRLASVSLAPCCTEAPYILNILTTELKHDSPSLGGSNQSRVYTIFYQVRYELIAHYGCIIPPRTLITTSTLILSPGEMIDSTNQLDILKRELYREIIIMMFNELNSPATMRMLMCPSHTCRRRWREAPDEGKYYFEPNAFQVEGFH